MFIIIKRNQNPAFPAMEFLNNSIRRIEGEIVGYKETEDEAKTFCDSLGGWDNSNVNVCYGGNWAPLTFVNYYYYIEVKKI